VKVLLTLPLTSQDSTAIQRLRALVGRCPTAGLASELPPQEAPVLIANKYRPFLPFMLFSFLRVFLTIFYIVISSSYFGT